MDSRPSGIRIFSVAFIVYGVINLMGLINYGSFKEALSGIPQSIIFLIYAFAVIYSIICIKCGINILKLEDWARKTSIFFVLASLVIGAFTNSLMLKNLKLSYGDNLQLQGVSLEAIMNTAIMLMVVFVAFEVGFVFYFTRPKIKAVFK